jgi:hypothetical protein
MEAQGDKTSCGAGHLFEDINHNMLEMDTETGLNKDVGVACPPLPQEVWLEVFRSLSEADLARVAQVSRSPPGVTVTDFEYRIKNSRLFSPTNITS